MENINLIDTFSEFKELKSIDRPTMVRVLEDSFRSVLAKRFGTDENFDVIINIEKYGNTTAGTLPLCLWEFQDQFKKGDNTILTAFGGGFTWGSLYLKWAI